MKQTIFILAISIFPITVFAESTLISPMIGGIDICQSAINKGMTNTYEAAKYCQSINETSSTLIEKKLSEFGPEKSKDGKFQMGYMLSFPLLSYVKINNDGSYEIDKEKIRYRLKLLHDTNRQAVIYLFSNHFSVSEGAKTEELITKIDSKNMMQLSDGTVPVDNYFSSKTYPWAINENNSLIDKIRKDAINEVLSQVCALDTVDKQKIRAVTVLGEVHYTFPDFFNGMGYRGEMKLTDYSEKSIKKFRSYLFEKYKSIKSLNDKIDSEYKSFDEINPPSKDINTVHLNNFFEHLDYASSGRLAIYGWAAGNNHGAAKIKIFIDGKDVGYAESGLSRMDVYQAMPTLGTSAVGYRYYLDFRKMSKGIHVVDVVHENNGKLTLMKSIDVPVIDRQQTKPVRVGEGVKLPEEKTMKFWNDYPESLKPVYYNPLSEEFYNFRKKEVANEIRKYADIVSSSCIGEDKTFSHQIAPMFNADWNEEKLAVEDSLKKNSYYNIGLNTYGSAFYGEYTFNWLKASGIERYGIPEAHPMVENEKVIYDALERHHNNGAIFISPYYFELKPESFGVDKEHEKFSISENNASYYSSNFYRALKGIMTE
ncbi:beta-galactosidase [Klebsiella sp. I138]|uniref:beta-galactosidase n=1 Tax=Klebsiella sp. I138 TaxID=2755385 RepID=UPI003DA9EEDE